MRIDAGDKIYIAEYWQTLKSHRLTDKDLETGRPEPVLTVVLQLIEADNITISAMMTVDEATVLAAELKRVVKE